MTPRWLNQLMKVNKELLLVLSIMAFAAVINFFVTGQKLVLAFYDLPTLFAAYYFGRARAVQTALASVLIICWLNVLHPTLPASGVNFASRQLLAWSDVAIWGGFLLITAYAMGTLYRNKEQSQQELRDAKLAVLQLLNSAILSDYHSQEHDYHTSIYSARIAEQLGLESQRVDDVRAAAILRGIGKLKPLRQTLESARTLPAEENGQETPASAEELDKLKLATRTLERILPFILDLSDATQRGGTAPARNQEGPLEVRIIRVAEAYDSLTTDWPNRKGLSPAEAVAVIAKGAGQDFDASVVAALKSALEKGPVEHREVLA